MTGAIRTLLVMLAALLWLSAAKSAGAPIPQPPAQAEQATQSTAAFDQLMAKLDNGAIVLNSQAAVRRVLERLHALLPPGDPYRQRRYDYIYCFLGFNNSAAAGYAYAAKGIEDAHRADDGQAEANFHFCRGLYQAYLTSERDSLPEYEAGIRIARHQENSRLVADGLTWRGGAESLLGEQARALIDFLQAQRLYEAEANDAAAEQNLVSIAVIYRRLGEYDKAGRYLDQSMLAARRKGDKLQQMAIEMQQGFLATERGRPEAAFAPLRRALSIARHTGSRESAGSALLALAEASNARDQYRDALDQLAGAQAEFEAAQDKSNAGMLALQLAEAHAGLGQHEQAARDFATAESKLRDSRNMRYLAELYAERSKNEEALGHPEAALADLKRKMKADAALAAMAKTQLTTLMSYQFDTERRELENRKLAADKASKDLQLAALQRIRSWQRLAILLGAVLILLMIWLAWRQLRSSRRLHRLAHTDALTGVANRRQIEHLLQRELATAAAGRRPLTVIMLDVDHFKAVNDSHGHQAGDRVLVEIVRACQSGLRPSDWLGRLGGEEFLVILPDTMLEAGMQVAERLRHDVAGLRMTIGETPLGLSISLGVAQLEAGETSIDPLLRRADASLYRAKDSGRNRVEPRP